MADETQTLTGVPEGVTQEHLNAGEVQGGEGLPTPPPVINTPPAKNTDDEEFFDPAAAEAEAKKKAEEEEAAKAADEGEGEEGETTDEAPADYELTGDVAADGIIEMFREAEIPVEVSDAIFREAAETGDLSKIDRAKLVEIFGEHKANMVVIAATDYYTRTVGNVQATVTAVHETVGGEKNWNTLIAWANKRAEQDPAFKTQLNEYAGMFEQNKTAATLAAKALREAYDADPKNKSLTTKMVTGNKSGGDLGSEPLSRNEYLERVKAAHDKGDYQEVARLDAQRLATRKQQR